MVIQERTESYLLLRSGHRWVWLCYRHLRTRGLPNTHPYLSAHHHHSGILWLDLYQPVSIISGIVHSSLIFRKWCFQSIAPGWIFSNITIHQLWYIFQYTIVTKNEIIPSQKNVVLDGCRYAFIGIYGIVLTWRIFWDHKNNLLKKIFNIPLLIISKNFTN